MIGQKFVSVIIPCRNEQRYIENCINSIFNQDYSSDKIEIIVVDGSSDDNTIQILEKYPKITLLSNPKKIVPISMNLGIRKAKGEYIVRIDAHCIYPTNYISELIFNSIKFNADNIGTIMETIPANSSVKAKVIAIALSHPLGVGNSYFRTGSSKIRQVDTVPFGCYKKEVFKNIGLYDEELIRNQDDELNGRLTQSGGKIILMPNIVLKYYARDTIKKVFSMFYQYGFFKPLVNLKLKKPATVRQFAPLLFVLAILTGFLAGLFNYLILKITLFCIGFYFFILLIISFKIIIIEKLKFISIIYFILTFFTIHWSYGWGYINGILTLIKNKIIN
tara:strand:- start:3216 stop:4217 length:1002 start_codon:yes stop_codon:yes gene_type:complete